jgi:hypothetical protein
MPIDYDAARSLLEDIFALAEGDLLQRAVPEIPEDIRPAFDIMFSSNTQAYREALVGCAIARMQDRTINIRLPYIKQGENAYNGRTLDEKVVNPFLQAHRIPCSRAPFLSTFRRGVQFDEGTTRGLRDIQGYRAFLALVGYLERTTDEDSLIQFLRYLLFMFGKLREAAAVPLTRLQRISLEQYGILISGLLGTPSGGRFPVLLVTVAFCTIKEFFGLNWEVTAQGINVADAAAGVGGDVTISEGGRTLLAAEITERPLDRNRVVSTFNTKIAPQGIEDYLFFVPMENLPDDVRIQARQYFAQGLEVNFLDVKNWILMSLATMGTRGRRIFNEKFMELLDAPDVPRSVKMAWNDQVDRLLGIQPTQE